MKNTETTPESQSPLIAPKLIAVMRDIPAIGKDSRNQSQGFNFRGIDSVYNDLNAVLAKHGVVTLPMAGTPTIEERTNAKGTVLRFVSLPMTYRFLAEDGSYQDCTTIGEGMDSGDKGTNKAMAIAHKYALLQTFLIPTEEQKDPDYETHEVVARPSKAIPPQENKEPTELPQNSLDMLASIMWNDEIQDDHVIHFLVAKKVKGVTKASKLKDLDNAVINRVIEKWEDVKAFKPVL
jgi:hypothetical protein